MPTASNHCSRRLGAIRTAVIRLPSRWWRFGGVALGCYVVVSVFGGVYWLVKLISPSTSSGVAAIWGMCATGPLVLGFVWERLSSLKVLGVEVSLAKAFVQVDDTLATALSASEQQYFSDDPAIFGLIERVIANPLVEILELNLRTTRYWWSTRLYLQAALAADYTNIRRLVFVAGDAERLYLGMASPSEVRRALAQTPGLDLEHAYRQIRDKVLSGPLPSNHTEVQEIVEQWTVYTFTKDGHPVTEKTAKTLAPSEVLPGWVALETEFVEWDRPLDSARLQARVLEKGIHFVPLTQNGRLVHVVNTDAFTREMATKTLRARLR